MTTTVNVETSLSAAPAAVWAVVGDTAGVANWIPSIESAYLAGDVRHATFVDGGGVAQERIEAHDDATMSYTYRYLDGPLALASYVSTIAVLPDGDGSRVTWGATFTATSPQEEAPLAQAIEAIYRSALDELGRQV